LNYAGQELDLFALANNWKRYYSSFFIKDLCGEILEVGAGIGSNTKSFAGQNLRWMALEPDPALAARLACAVQGKSSVEVINSTLETLPASNQFDAILYLDVLEHISDDRRELELAESHLRLGGKLIVLSPSHEKLFSEFDRAIGHLRRYNKYNLKKIIPSSLRLESLRYLDSVGATLSMTNRFYLKQSYPTKSQILFWDRRIIPLSKIFDRLTGYSIGKSILGIWTKR
jgi:SAM-dependent methyltransferase